MSRWRSSINAANKALKATLLKVKWALIHTCNDTYVDAHTHTRTHTNTHVHTHGCTYVHLLFIFQHNVSLDGSVSVEVTLNNVVTEVMTAAKTLKQLNVDIPDPALQILKQVMNISIRLSFLCNSMTCSKNSTLYLLSLVAVYGALYVLSRVHSWFYVSCIFVHNHRRYKSRNTNNKWRRHWLIFTRRMTWLNQL